MILGPSAACVVNWQVKRSRNRTEARRNILVYGRGCVAWLPYLIKLGNEDGDTYSLRKLLISVVSRTCFADLGLCSQASRLSGGLSSQVKHVVFTSLDAKHFLIFGTVTSTQHKGCAYSAGPHWSLCDLSSTICWLNSRNVNWELCNIRKLWPGTSGWKAKQLVYLSLPQDGTMSVLDTSIRLDEKLGTRFIEVQELRVKEETNRTSLLYHMQVRWYQ